MSAPRRCWSSAIGPGHGRVRIGDSTWLAAGPDLPAGSRVRIVGARGALLLVPGGPGPDRSRATIGLAILGRAAYLS